MKPETNLEDWEEQLNKARQEGYKKGVTVGYAQGSADTFPNAAGIGYMAYKNDLLTVMDEIAAIGSLENKIFIQVIDRIAVIERVRLETNIYTSL